MSGNGGGCAVKTRGIWTLLIVSISGMYGPLDGGHDIISHSMSHLDSEPLHGCQECLVQAIRA